MKQFTAMLFASFMIMAVTAVILGSRKDLCEIRFRAHFVEVAVSMACETIR
ncbi:Hok/Gef family protein [Pantoea cypripedii]|uniref:Hok/Gef family protein n=1 Tax=Pantoea cypripedii TaxID=55209 RepID=UPI002FC847A5